MNSAGHLTPEEAAAFTRSDGELSATERLVVSDHAATCDVCRTLLAQARAERGTADMPPDLTRVFTRLIEAGRQEENPAQEAWTGAEEFSATLPEKTPAEREGARALEMRMSNFESEAFVPGGTLSKTGREVVRQRTAVVESGGWWQRLFSWQGMSLAGAMAVVVLAVLVLPRSFRGPTSGPVAVTQPSPRADLVDGPLQVTLDGALAGAAAIPTDLREAVLETIRRGTVPGALLKQLTRGGAPGTSPVAGVTATGDPAAAVPVSPVGTSVETDQPVFRWRTGATPGTVEIVVRPSAGGEETRSLPLPAGTTEWTPAGTLPRGALYRWQIVPVSPDGQETGSAVGTKPGAVFKVLSADARERLEALRAGPSGGSHLTLGVAYAREGLKEESAQEFRALKESNAQSVLAKRLLDSVEGRGGQG